MTRVLGVLPLLRPIFVMLIGAVPVSASAEVFECRPSQLEFCAHPKICSTAQEIAKAGRYDASPTAAPQHRLRIDVSTASYEEVETGSPKRERVNLTRISDAVFASGERVAIFAAQHVDSGAAFSRVEVVRINIRNGKTIYFRWLFIGGLQRQEWGGCSRSAP